MRRAEVTGAIAIAADAGIGHPPETALRTCLVAVARARAMALDEEEAATRITPPSSATPGARRARGDGHRWRRDRPAKHARPRERRQTGPARSGQTRPGAVHGRAGAHAARRRGAAQRWAGDHAARRRDIPDRLRCSLLPRPSRRRGLTPAGRRCGPRRPDPRARSGTKRRVCCGSSWASRLRRRLRSSARRPANR